MLEILTNVDLAIFLRLAAATGVGAILGLERTLAGKTAGVRTYGLVSLGSALFVTTGQLVAQHYFQLGIGGFDPLRLASQIIVGIGFLGAGLIVFRQEKLEGLTTAAGLWVTAAIGTALGFGLYRLALFTTVLTLFTFTVLWFLERFLSRQVPPKTF